MARPHLRKGWLPVDIASALLSVLCSFWSFNFLLSLAHALLSKLPAYPNRSLEDSANQKTNPSEKSSDLVTSSTSIYYSCFHHNRYQLQNHHSQNVLPNSAQQMLIQNSCRKSNIYKHNS